MNVDYVNALFELGGAFMLWGNVWKLSKDKMVRGVHWGPVGFFAVWGLWNLIFYPALNQWFSFYAGLALTTGNLVWLTQMLYYRKR